MPDVEPVGATSLSTLLLREPDLLFGDLGECRNGRNTARNIGCDRQCAIIVHHHSVRFCPLLVPDSPRQHFAVITYDLEDYVAGFLNDKWRSVRPAASARVTAGPAQAPCCAQADIWLNKRAAAHAS
jgi:hypothetical protein